MNRKRVNLEIVKMKMTNKMMEVREITVIMTIMIKIMKMRETTVKTKMMMRMMNLLKALHNVKEREMSNKSLKLLKENSFLYKMMIKKRKFNPN